MGENMCFPETAGEFIKAFSFADKEEVYTNGTVLIPVFRVEQMLEHYFREDKHSGAIEGLTFGDALEAAKQGERIARKGWNGRNMYVFIAHEADFVTDADISAFDGVEVEVGDMFVMKTAGDTFQPGWLASQADMLADDWYIVE